MKRLDIAPSKENILESLENNLCLRREDIVRFIKLLNDIEPPFAICINAPWGDGKTFFVKSVMAIIEAQNPNVDNCQLSDLPTWACEEFEGCENISHIVPFYFNAWENDMLGNPLGSIIASMTVDSGIDFGGSESKIGHKAASVIDAISGLIGYTSNFSGIVEAFSGEKLIEEYEKRRTLESDIDNYIDELMREKADYVVLFVDELDRCHPEYAIKLLRDIKNLFENDRLIIVYSADLYQLSSALQGFYGDSFSAKRYLERFYDYRFDFLTIERDRYFFDGQDSSIRSGRYDKIVKELTDAYSETFRDMNRLRIKVEQARGFATGPHGNNYEIMFIECCLLPVFLFVSYEMPEVWNEIDKEESHVYVFEAGKKSSSFIKYLDESIRHTYNSELEITDKVRREYISDLCNLIFLSWRDQSERRSKSLKNIKYDISDEVDCRKLRSLDFEKS